MNPKTVTYDMLSAFAFCQADPMATRMVASFDGAVVDAYYWNVDKQAWVSQGEFAIKTLEEYQNFLQGHAVALNQ